MESPKSEDFTLVEIEDFEEQLYGVELKQQPPETLLAIQKWLQPTDHNSQSGEYFKHLHSHVTGTGNWVRETEVFQQWRDQPQHGLLWIKGTAGAGKSVLAATIVDSIVRHEDFVPVLFFFFRQIVATNHHPQSLARDFVSLLLDYSPSLQARVKQYIDDNRTLDDVSAGELWQDLTQALASLPKVYCVIDALDEMDIDQQAFLEKFVQLGKQNSASIKVLVTSRPLPRIEAAFKDTVLLQIRLEQRLVDRDIAVYVGHRLEESPDLDLDLRNSIKQAILEKAQGSFLYSRLMMDELLTGHLPHMIPDIKYLQRSLDWLPITLEDMYNGMLLDHSLRSGVPIELQVSILSWVTHSSRPLRLLELATVLAAGPDTNIRDPKALVRPACGPLLEILEDETVSVIHHSFTEFLTDTVRGVRTAPGSVHPQFPTITAQVTHRTLALACIDYLTGDCLSSWTLNPRDSIAAVGTHKLRFPLLDYAAKNWYIHASKLTSLDDHFCSKVESLLQPESHIFCAWYELEWFSRIRAYKPHSLTPLHIAAWAGMLAYAKHLIDQKACVDALDTLQRTALTWAAIKGHTNITSLLLTNGADPDPADDHGKKPLHYAAQANHSLVVTQLLLAGVSPLTPKTKENPGRKCGNMLRTKGQSPLLLAVQSDSIDSIREMLPYLGARDLNFALHIASASGHADVVDILLSQPGISVDTPELPNTPLFLAACCMNSRCIKSLLSKGADPMMKSCDWQPLGSRHNRESTTSPGRTKSPFHGFAGVPSRFRPRNVSEQNIKICFDLLFQAGCDINAREETGLTPLHICISSRSRDHTPLITTLLLEHGAGFSLMNNAGETPLHVVELSSDGVHIAELLLQFGADMTARRLKDGCTPLHTIFQAYVAGVDIKPLLGYVADWNVVDFEGNTPLHAIFQRRYNAPEGLVGSVLAAGANPNLKNKQGQTPLHHLNNTDGKSPSIIAVLVNSGADLEIRDIYGRSPLLTSSCFIALLDAGADPHVADHNGNSLLHTMWQRVGGADFKSFEAAIAAGCDIWRVNYEGNTLLHQVVKQYIGTNLQYLRSVVEYLLHAGMSPTAKNARGLTPMHYICSYVPPPIPAAGQHFVNYLLETSLADGIDIGDTNGVKPIHLAASISETLVSKLIDHGADPTAFTDESRNILHIAARARQSNTIGLVLQHFSIAQPYLLNTSDRAGRTPLHDACRSGRPESVALLLKYGADPTLKDKQGNTPLHACSEFLEEEKLWGLVDVPSNLQKTIGGNQGMADGARGVLLTDTSRPYQDCNVLGPWDPITKDHQATRVAEIVKMLVRSGANPEARNNEGRTALEVAVIKGCSEAAQELRRLTTERSTPGDGGIATSEVSFKEGYLGLRSSCLPEYLKSQVRVGEANTELCNQLLSLREFRAMEILPSLGVKFGSKENGATDFLSTLAAWGYADLLSKLGATMAEPGWVNGKEVLQESIGKQHEENIRPYLHTAATRQFPNLEVLKVLVEQFHADVNKQQHVLLGIRGKDSKVQYQSTLGSTAMHILAQSIYWWQPEGLEYLLKHGGNTEIVNETGDTVLSLALMERTATYRHRSVRILLDNGANPNAKNNSGRSCLDKAAYDNRLVEMLIQAGAVVDSSSLMSAVKLRDVNTVRAILDAGVDPKLAQKAAQRKATSGLDQVDPEEYPLHQAAKIGNLSNYNHGAMIDIIKLLLDHGADPWAPITTRNKKKSTIIHDAFASDSILDLFYDLEDLELERRDDQSRTLLLAACCSSGFRNRVNYPLISMLPSVLQSTMNHVPAIKLYHKGANIRAVDIDGNNVLHCLVARHSVEDAIQQTVLTHFASLAPDLTRAKNNAAATPLHIAVSRGKLSETNELIAHGGDLHDLDAEGNTLLHHVVTRLITSPEEQSPWLPLFHDLLAAGVSINTPNAAGITPIFEFFSATSQTLFRNGQPPRPHWHMSQDAHRESIAPLLAAGADLFVRDRNGEGLLHVVAKKKVEAPTVNAFKYLLEMGLDPSLEDVGERSALDVASASGNTGILELFQRDKGDEGKV